MSLWEVGTRVLGVKRGVLVRICVWVRIERANACMGEDKHVVSCYICTRDEGCEPNADVEGAMVFVFFLTCAQRKDALYLANFIFSCPKYSLDALEGWRKFERGHYLYLGVHLR